jgi:hypothetical protein
MFNRFSRPHELLEQMKYRYPEECQTVTFWLYPHDQLSRSLD